jgi:dUTPase
MTGMIPVSYVISFRKINQNALFPTIVSGGMNLYSPFDRTIPYNCFDEINTGLELTLPPNFQGLLSSSLEWEKSLIHSSILRGGSSSICVTLFNPCERDQVIKRGDEISFLTFENPDVSWGSFFTYEVKCKLKETPNEMDFIINKLTK